MRAIKYFIEHMILSVPLYIDTNKTFKNKLVRRIIYVI